METGYDFLITIIGICMTSLKATSTYVGGALQEII